MLPLGFIVTGLRSFSKLLATPATLERRLVRTAVMVSGDRRMADRDDRRRSADQPSGPGDQGVRRSHSRLPRAAEEDGGVAATGVQPTVRRSSTSIRKLSPQAIRLARQKARPGDIFGDAGSQFREIIRQDARERSVRDIFAAMEEVPRQPPPRVNLAYPETSGAGDGAAAHSQPASSAAGRDRVPLHGQGSDPADTNANLIVDFIHEAVPTIRR